MRKQIDFGINPSELISMMSEGNMGAMDVLAKIMLTMGRMGGMFFILNLDDMNMWGSQIWTAYKDYCGEDMSAFVDAITKRDAKMVETVNIETAKCGGGAKAVTGGASYERKELTDAEVAELKNKPKSKYEKSEDFDF